MTSDHHYLGHATQVLIQAASPAPGASCVEFVDQLRVLTLGTTPLSSSSG